jgi:ABC-type cobalamin/Fe3+-siderophores transport system ATPase subunit
MLVLKLWPEYFAQRMWILSLALVWTGKLSTQLTTFIHKILKSRNHMISYFRVTEYLDRHEDLSKKKMHKIDLSNRAVEIKNVSFWYNKEVMVLKNLSLEIKSRERVAIIGKPGSGKSTFVNLLMGLYSQKEKEHEDEMVKIYGQNMNEFDSMTWRKKVNYLSSNPKVFYGTLKKNIDPEDRYSTEEIIKVLHFLKLINYKDTQDLEELLQMDQECDGELLRNMSFDSFDISQMGDSMRIDELTDEEDSESERLSPPQLKSLSKVQERRMSKFNPKIKIREMKVNTPKYSRKSRKSKLGWSQVLKSVKAKKPIKGNSKIKGNLKKLNFDRRSSAMLQLRSPNKARISSIVVSPRSTKSPNKTFNFTQIQAALKKLTGPAKKASKNSFKKYTYDKKDELYIKQFLDMKAKNSEILTESMIKIAMMAKAFLEKSPMMILEDQAFHFEMLDDDYYYDVFWDYLKDSTIISILSDYNHLLRYDRVFVFKDGKVEESGKPIDLLKNKNSLLGEYVKEGNPELFENFKEMFNREEERREEIRGEKNNLWSNLQGKAMEIVEKSKKRRKSRRMRTIEQINALFVV